MDFSWLEGFRIGFRVLRRGRTKKFIKMDSECNGATFHILLFPNKDVTHQAAHQLNQIKYRRKSPPKTLVMSSHLA